MALPIKKRWQWQQQPAPLRHNVTSFDRDNKADLAVAEALEITDVERWSEADDDKSDDNNLIRRRWRQLCLNKFFEKYVIRMSESLAVQQQEQQLKTISYKCRETWFIV